MGSELYDLEPELSYPVPRSVRVNLSVQAVRALLVLLLVGVCLAVRSCGQADLDNTRLLERDGKTTTGKITGRSVEHNRNSDDYYLSYEYVVNGQAYQSSASASENEYKNTPDGSPVVITYLPSKPDDHEVGRVTGSSIIGTIVTWIFIGFWPILFFGLLVIAKEYAIRRQMRLLREGTATQGVVADMRAYQSRMSRFPRTYYRVTCNYQAGQAQISKRFTVSLNFYSSLFVGENLTIVYLPKSPWTSLPYRFITGMAIVPPKR